MGNYFDKLLEAFGEPTKSEKMLFQKITGDARSKNIIYDELIERIYLLFLHHLKENPEIQSDVFNKLNTNKKSDEEIISEWFDLVSKDEKKSEEKIKELAGENNIIIIKENFKKIKDQKAADNILKIANDEKTWNTNIENLLINLQTLTKNKKDLEKAGANHLKANYTVLIEKEIISEGLLDKISTDTTSKYDSMKKFMDLANILIENNLDESIPDGSALSRDLEVELAPRISYYLLKSMYDEDISEDEFDKYIKKINANLFNKIKFEESELAVFFDDGKYESCGTDTSSSQVSKYLSLHVLSIDGPLIRKGLALLGAPVTNQNSN